MSFTPIPVKLIGSPNERGIQQGRVFKPYIHEAVDRYLYQINYLTKQNPKKFLEFFLKSTQFLPAIEKWTPNIMQELRGMAQGAHIDFDLLFTLQLQDEIQWFVQELMASTNTNSPKSIGNQQHCTTLGCQPTESSPALVAQNLDHHIMYDGLETIIHLTDPSLDRQTYVFTFTGLIALLGMNDGPLGIVCNALIRFLNNRVDGLPVTFVLRGVLERGDVASAMEFLRTIRHASGQNYILGDPQQVVCVECSANQIQTYLPHPTATRVYHTNHPLVNTDLIKPPPQQREGETTYNRLAYLAARLNEATNNIDATRVKLILSSHQGLSPLCVHHNYTPDHNYTMGSCVCVLNPAPRAEFHLAISNPCNHPFSKYTF